MRVNPRAAALPPGLAPIRACSEHRVEYRYIPRPYDDGVAGGWVYTGLRAARPTARNGEERAYVRGRDREGTRHAAKELHMQTLVRIVVTFVLLVLLVLV